MSVINVTIDNIQIQAEKWQDPYGPSHSFFLSLPHIKRGIPQKCAVASYQCVRLLARGPNAKDELSVAVPKLSDIQFGIQVLGFSMPWAWNKYLEDKEVNDQKYAEYCNQEIEAYFKNFLERAKLLGKYLSLLKI